MKHPRSIYTLFFTEMWERFSYYGMRALLMLYLVDQVHGLKLSDATAGSIVGLYMGLVYLSALPGGLLGDLWLGAKRAVWWGGVIIAVGHLLLSAQQGPLFYVGLLVVALGSGLLKSNMSSLVGQLYPEGGAAKDAGYTLFYMGINLGAFIGPLVCGKLAADYGWHWGFGAAAVGMGLGLLQFWRQAHLLGDAGAPPQISAVVQGRLKRVVLGSLLALAVVVLVIAKGLWQPDVKAVVKVMAGGTLCLAAAFFLWTLLFQGLSRVEKLRLGMMALIFLASVLFWAGFEQIGTSFSLIAERSVDRVMFGSEVPASWFQSVNPVLVICLAPAVGAVWLWLAGRSREPSLPAKLGWSLLLLAAGYVVAVLFSHSIAEHGKIGPLPLILTIALLTLGELCISPIGLSAVSKLSPPHLVSRFMGVFFLASAVGGNVAGLFGGEVAGVKPEEMAEHFLTVVIATGALGCVLLISAPWLKRLMAGAK